jgi:hypothetical protein
VVRRDEALRAGAVFRLRVAAAFRPAVTRFGDFLAVVRFRAGDFLEVVLRAVDLRAVVRFRAVDVRAFRAALAFRLRVAAAFRPAAARFGDFREVVRRAVDVRALRAALVFRLRVAAAFRPAAARFGDFLAVVRVRVGDFRAVVFRAVVRFLDDALRAGAVFRLRVAAFRPAAARFGDFRAVVRLAADLRAVAGFRLDVARFAVLFAARLRAVAFLVAVRAAVLAVRDRVAATRSPSPDIPGAGVGIAVSRRSGAIIPPCSGALGRSTVCRSQPGPGGRYGSGIDSSRSDVPIPSLDVSVSVPDASVRSSVSFHGQVRSDMGMRPPPSCGSRVPLPRRRRRYASEAARS